MQPVEILDKVIENYESGRVRWRQYLERGPSEPGRCVAQAIWADSNQEFLPYRRALKAVQDHVHAPSVPFWNDNPDLTFSAMLNTLKTVANGLRSNT